MQYPLTPMQNACWFGRCLQALTAEDEVSEHLYLEFGDGAIDLEKLQQSVNILYQKHGILRLFIAQNGTAIFNNSQHELPVEVEDLRHLSLLERQKFLLTKREMWSHYQSNVSNVNSGEIIKISLSQLTDSSARLHINIDMIALDPYSIRIFIEQLARLYNGDGEGEFEDCNFYDHIKTLGQHQDFQLKKETDCNWWHDKFASIAPSLQLPKPAQKQIAKKSQRLNATIDNNRLQELRQLAKANDLTLTHLTLAMFAVTLGLNLNQSSFRLNVPFFHQHPHILNNDCELIGEFADFTIVNCQVHSDSCLSDIIKNLKYQLIQAIEHSGQYSGIELMRDFSKHTKAIQPNPVVFTSAVDMINGNLFSEQVIQAFGSMQWCISQAPNVAIDAQLVQIEDELLINWDVRCDLVDFDWVCEIFADYVKLLKRLNKNQLSKPAKMLNLCKHKPLNALQKSYLFGRLYSPMLGGVAMQDVREYQGLFDIAKLRANLQNIVQKNAALRTYIHIKDLTWNVKSQPILNMHEIDLSHLTNSQLYDYLDKFRHEYASQSLDFDRPLWNITVIRHSNNSLSVFTKFDATILDGRSISNLISELFKDGEKAKCNSPKQIINNTYCLEKLNNKIDEDKRYWSNKLANLQEMSPKWRIPLEKIKKSKFQRQTLVLEFGARLLDRAARVGFLENTVITSIILEAFAQWAGLDLAYAAIPVLPMYTGEFSNKSTFIIVQWLSGDMIKQAKELQTSILEGLNHLHYSGIDLSHQISRSISSPIVAPLVVTNMMSWQSLPNDHTMYYHWGLTQSPNIALDIRFAIKDGSLYFDIDYVTQALDDEDISCIMKNIYLNAQWLIEQVDDNGDGNDKRS
ncbi:condensation domain-containing protein [Moraxella marmotae]|uniref:condensation domain-containing protein n=1 Tax=Moraxella marmotae TaxID=3344520 RepID=UPI0035F4C89F